MDEIREIPIEMIEVTGQNPRDKITPESVKDLVDSIKTVGKILVPLKVRLPEGKETKFKLCWGERRLTAAPLAGLKTVPCIVSKMTDEEFAIEILIENLKKELAPLEVARGLKSLADKGMKQIVIAKTVGKSQAWVSSHLMLLELKPEMQDLVIREIIPLKSVRLVRDIADYPVYKDVMAAFKDETQKLTEQDLARRITRQIENSANAFNLDDWSFELEFDGQEIDTAGLEEFFDDKACNNCAKTYYNGEEHFCLDLGCLAVKIDAAKKVAQAADEKAKAKVNDTLVKEMKKVSTDKLNRDEYELLAFAEFNKGGCASCKTKGKDKDNDPICLNPKCFAEKTGNHKKDAAAKKKATAEALIASFEAWASEKESFFKKMYSMDPVIWDSMFMHTLTHEWHEAVKRGMSFCLDKKTYDYAKEGPKKITGYMRIYAILRIQFFRGSGLMNNSYCDNVEKESMRIYPHLQEFYTKPAIAKATKDGKKNEKK